MKITKQSSFANTAIVGNVTYRMVGTYGSVILVGGVLFMTPFFKWNILAMVAYVALALIIVGHTPTNRTLLYNIYGLLFKKTQRSVVSDQTTTTTLGHGVKEVLNIDDMDAPAFKLNNGKFAFVYQVTSDINRWSGDVDYALQAQYLKTLMNTFEGGESLMIVTKQDADTGMLQLEEALDDEEDFEGDDLKALSDQRKNLLHAVAVSKVGRSVQQYAILIVKPKNMNRCVKALKRSARLISPATNPGDVLLSVMGLEAGADQELYNEGGED